MNKLKNLVAKKVLITQVLLAFFFLSQLHNLLHNSHDHDHDNTCSVYILEEFFTAADVVLQEDVALPFLSFTYVEYFTKCFTSQTFQHFAIRAPPLESFFS